MPNAVLRTLFPAKGERKSDRKSSGIAPECDPRRMHDGEEETEGDHSEEEEEEEEGADDEDEEDDASARMRDVSAARLIFGNAIAGAALALGFRFAGTYCSLLLSLV